MIKVAIIDDDPEIVDDICAYIAQTNDMEVFAKALNFNSGKEIIYAGGFDVLLCDLGLPDGSGIDLIRISAKLNPKAEIIVITIFAEQAKVINSIKAGARSYILKDERLNNCTDAIRETLDGGSAISPAIARHLVKLLRPPQPEEAINKIDEPLSPREFDVLNLLARGFSVIETANILNISRHTIATHVKHIYSKLEVNSRTEAIFEATSRGIIDIH
jgi:DNA-binding NarL/FixJ family response regulator